MELQRDQPPDYEHIEHRPESLKLPAVPQHAIASATSPSNVTLPDLKTVLSPQFEQMSPSRHTFVTPLSPPRSLKGHSRNTSSRKESTSTRRSTESSSITISESSSSREGRGRHARDKSVVSVDVDDPKVREAAEALSELGNKGFARSPPNANSHVLSHASPNDAEEEPLLTLFTQAHPWFAAPINGSLSAYAQTKLRAPRLLQYGVNMVERNLTSPVVSTVSTVGRMTGVESGLRWYLQAKPSDAVDGDSVSSKRKYSGEEMDIEAGLSSPLTRFDSSDPRMVEDLPAYRASKPPSYREEVSPDSSQRYKSSDGQTATWSSRVLYSASGLGVAMSNSSRNSIMFCLGALSQATVHITTVMDALKMVLDQYDRRRAQWRQYSDSSLEKGGHADRPSTPDNDDAARVLAAVIQKHCEDIMRTLKLVVNNVSTSVGGALPENARIFVRDQLMSLPQRYHFVSQSTSADSDTVRGAHRMIAFAHEGLDMMGQVSQVCKATLDSANDWLARVGRPRLEAEPEPKGSVVDEDHPMADAV
nr:clock-controlled protein 8 [Quercus suber]